MCTCIHGYTHPCTCECREASGIGFSWSWATGACELPDVGCWGPNSGPFKDRMLLTTAPSLSPDTRTLDKTSALLKCTHCPQPVCWFHHCELCSLPVWRVTY